MNNKLSNSEKIIVLDRDGVINHDSDNFIKSVDEWQAIDGSLNAIAKLNHAGFKVFVVTNQSGIARNLFSIETLNHIHSKMRHLVAEANGEIENIYFCPHGPNDHCECRKPKAGLYQQLATEYAVNFNNVFSVGDSIRDLEAAKAAGAKPILVLTGKGTRSNQTLQTEENHPLRKTPVYLNLAEFVDQLINSNRS